MSSVQAGQPLWTMTVESGNNEQTIPENVTATITYKVQNQSRKSKILALQPTPGHLANSIIVINISPF